MFNDYFSTEKLDKIKIENYNKKSKDMLNNINIKNNQKKQDYKRKNNNPIRFPKISTQLKRFMIQMVF